MPTLPKPKRENKSRLKFEAWYRSVKWIKLSRLFRAKNPFCVECKKEGVLTDCSPGTGNGVTDHIKPVSSGESRQMKWLLMWSWDNLQTLCNSHHASKSSYEGKQ